MRKCLYCYNALDKNDLGDYHAQCNKLFYGNTVAPVLPYKLSDMAKIAKQAAELSIRVAGVQPKLSLGWIKNELENDPQNRLTILDALDGNYILKPQNELYAQMPENEHLSMMLAALFKIDTVPHNMIRLQSGELCYITKRIDRKAKDEKIHMIDFMQILELEDKYKGTMESLGKKIGELSANTLLDKLRFLELAILNFIIGNNDMHLKNFSMIRTDLGWVLAPAYDLLNVKIILPKDKEDTALLLGGKKMNFDKKYFDRLGRVLALNEKQIQGIYKKINKWLPKANKLIDQSFLTAQNRKGYKKLIAERSGLFGVG